MLETNNIKYNYLFATLILAFFLFTPWNRMWAEYCFFTLFLASSIQLLTLKATHKTIHIPKEAKKLIWFFILIPSTSIISYIFTPLDNLTTETLEPDSRWLLFIPIFIATLHNRLHPSWVITALAVYCISAFSKGLIETTLATEISRRAWGDENPNPFGMFNAVISLMLMCYLLTPVNNKPKLTLKGITLMFAISTCIILGIISTYFTGTRTALFLLAVGMMIFLITNIKSKASWAIVASTLILSIYTLNTPSGHALKERVTSMPDKASAFITKGSSNNSTGQRLEQWRGSICGFLKHPATGTGPRSAREAFGKYSGKEDCNLTLQVEPGPRQTHSLFFNTLLTLGSLGILVFAAFFIQLLKTSREYYSSTQHWVKMGAGMLFVYVLGMAINGIALDMWFRNYMVNKNLMALLLVFIAIHSGTQKNRSSANEEK